MSNQEKVKRITTALLKLEKAMNNSILKKVERKWIQKNPRINLLNYFYYRYLTNSFELSLLRTKK